MSLNDSKIYSLAKSSVQFMLFFMNQPTDDQISSQGNYWHTSLKYFRKLVLWFSVSFGCGILFKDKLDEIHLGEPTWLLDGSTGSILCFVGLLIAYSF